MTKQELINKMAHTLIHNDGWGISFNKGSGHYTDLAGGDLTVIAPDVTTANLCVVVRDRPEMRRDDE